MRYALGIEYDGSGFHGWQRLSHGPTVQASVEQALGFVLDHPVEVVCAGRTDAGVHASGQAAHVDIIRPTPADKVRDAINAHLRPAPVSVLSAEVVDDAFHARFSATGRRYVYRIINRRAPLALDAGRAWQVGMPLDADAMREAATRLLGHHDFTTFRSAACQARSPVKTLDRLDVTRSGDEIRLEIAARSFLHNQVRIMAGTLKLVGEGKWSVSDVAAALAACDRTRGGPTAPPDGLYLAEVRYDGGSGAAGQASDDAVDDDLEQDADP